MYYIKMNIVCCNDYCHIFSKSLSFERISLFEFGIYLFSISFSTTECIIFIREQKYKNGQTKFRIDISIIRLKYDLKTALASYKNLTVIAVNSLAILLLINFRYIGQNWVHNVSYLIGVDIFLNEKDVFGFMFEMFDENYSW